MRNIWLLALCLLVVGYLSVAWPTEATTARGEQPALITASTAAAADDESAEQDDDEADDDDDADANDEDEDEDADDDASDDEDDNKSDEDEDKADKEKKEAKKSERKTHTMKAAPLKVEVETDATFVAREMSEVELDPEAWSDFEIEEIVPHGATVHKGEVLVKFDSEKIKEAIDNLELDQRLNELSIIKAEQELPRLEKSIKDTFEQSERTLAEARVDYDNYQQIDRDMLVRSIDMSLKSTEQSVENAREELRQLEKMYEADDLTEETEEIILQRQRAEVEQYEFFLERAKLSHDRNLELYLPRNDVAEKEYLDRVEMAFARAKTAMETDLDRARYELEKSKRARKKSLERHADLTSDLGLLEIKAPADGVVYYGSCDDGTWSDMANMIDKLKVENKAPTGSTLMTVVGPDQLYLQSTIKEVDRPSLKSGQHASIQPTATDSPKLEGRVSELSTIPVATGKFSMEVDITTDDLPEWLVAGMTGKVKVTTYHAKEALLAPKKAVHTDDEDEAKYVWLVDGDDVERREVKTGKTKDDDIEILSGLKAGDVISLDDEKASDDDE